MTQQLVIDLATALFATGLGLVCVGSILLDATRYQRWQRAALPEPEPQPTYTPSPEPDPIPVIEALMQTAVRRGIAVDRVGGLTVSLAWDHLGERWRACHGTRGAYFRGGEVGAAGEWLLERVAQRVSP